MQPLERAVAKALARRAQLRAMATTEISVAPEETPTAPEPLEPVQAPAESLVSTAIDAQVPDLNASEQSDSTPSSEATVESINKPAENPAESKLAGAETVQPNANGPQDAFTLLLSGGTSGAAQKRQDAPAVRSPKQRIKSLSSADPKDQDSAPGNNAEEAANGEEAAHVETAERARKPSLRSWFSPKQDPNPPPPPTQDPGLEDLKRD